LERLRVPYCIVGGIANLVWGEPRATVDVDVSVSVDEAAVTGFVEVLGREFAILVESPARFVSDTRVLPMQDRRGVRIDVIFALLPFERDVIERAVDVDMGSARVKVCTAEDLILMKIISERERDLADAEAIARRRHASLDLAYLQPRI